MALMVPHLLPTVRLSGSFSSCTIRSANHFLLPHRSFSPLRCSSPRESVQSPHLQTLVAEVKERLLEDHPDLPVGEHGRDDERIIRRFLKDRKYSVDDAVLKLSKAIKWRRDFGVSELTEEAVGSLYKTRKAYVHDSLDITGRPVLVVVASKHFPGKQDTKENEKLCVYLIEKALSKLSPGKEEILGIFDLRGFGTENGDIQFLKFLIDVFYFYYPRRLGQVLFVGAPFLFQPIWQVVRPWLKSYASLVRFCDAEIVRKEYFTSDTVPFDFRS